MTPPLHILRRQIAEIIDNEGEGLDARDAFHLAEHLHDILESLVQVDIRSASASSIVATLYVSSFDEAEATVVDLADSARAPGAVLRVYGADGVEIDRPLAEVAQ